MAIQYKSMVKPMPGSRSQAPMSDAFLRNMDFRPGDEQGIQAQTLPGNPMQPMRAGDIQMLAGGIMNAAPQWGGTSPGISTTQAPAFTPGATTPSPMPAGGMGTGTPGMSAPGLQAPLPGPQAFSPNPAVYARGTGQVAGQQGYAPGMNSGMVPQMGGPSVGNYQAPLTAGSVPAPAPPPVAPPHPTGIPNMMSNGRPAFGPGQGMGWYYDNNYNPSEAQRRADDARVAQYQSWNRAAGSGPYDTPAALNRFQSLETHQPNTMRPPTSDWKLGQGDEQYAKNRKASGRVTAYVGGAAGQARSLTPEQIQANRDRARGREESLKTGRRDRAIEKYGLTHLTPSYGTNAKAPATGDGPSVSPDASQAERQAAAARSTQHPIFTDAAKDNYDPNTANIQQSQEFFFKKRGNWSAEDISAFKQAMEDRAVADKDKFGKEWNDFKNQTEWKGDPSLRDNEVFRRVNEFRVALGLKPLVYVDEPIPKPNPIPSGPPGMLTPGFGTVR